MKKILFSILICLSFGLFSCTADKVKDVTSGIEVESDMVIPSINYLDMGKLLKDMEYFSSTFIATESENVYSIVVSVDKAKNCPFKNFTYEYTGDGVDGFKFYYEYDESNNLSAATKSKINQIYSQDENTFPIGSSITNKKTM